MTTTDCLVSYRVRLRIAYTIIEPGPQAITSILDAVKVENDQVRIPGLDDDLDPYIVDPGKVEAFLDGLSRLPVATWEALSDRVLYLASPTLYLSRATPVTVECLSRGFSMSVPEEPLGGVVQPILHCDIDTLYAQQLSSRSRQATEEFNKEVERLDAVLRTLDSLTDPKGYSKVLGELSQARFKRCSVSMVWRDSSAAQSRANRHNGTLKRAAREAEKAASRYLMPPRTGMPGPG